MKTTAIILAGGKSRRFGSDKSLLRWQGQPIVERLAQECSSFADEVLIISNQPAKFCIPGVRELSDRYPGLGPLGGIHAGLLEASGESVFVTACDMPLLKAEMAQELLARLKGWDAVVPRDGERLQPLFSAMAREQGLKTAEEMLQQGEKRMRTFFRQMHTCYWDCPGWEVFYNMNYPADYERLLAGERKDACG